ncbi:MAG: hypothetical protein AAGI27_00585 [Pseudomonadota bacterium]
MSAVPATFLKRKPLNGWTLFWLASGVISAAMVIETLRFDLASPGDVSHLIGFSVRMSVPFIYLVVAASALPVLFPGSFSTWLLRNRKYIGLCFAVAMAWQGLFIYIMSTFHRGYYFEEVFYLRDELEGSTGYLFLTAMVITSFQFGRRFLDSQQWKLLHRAGVYFLWAYPFAVYWWSISYYGNPTLLDYLFYWTGFFVFALRIAAWGKKRLKGAAEASIAFRAGGWALVVAGLLLAAATLYWQAPMTDFLLAPDWSANLVLWLPFWPFEPFLSLFVMGLGTALMTHARH